MLTSTVPLDDETGLDPRKIEDQGIEEADRELDEGFENEVDAVFPPEGETDLDSASPPDFPPDSPTSPPPPTPKRAGRPPLPAEVVAQRERDRLSRPKGKPGRPPLPPGVKLAKDQARFLETRKDVPHLPKPPGYKVPPPKFFKYWSDTNAKFPDRLTLYVYRRWPVIDRDRVPGQSRNIAKVEVPFEDCDNFESEVLHRWGSGDYRFDLADAGLSKKVCQCSYSIRDQDYPPDVTLDDLVMEEPNNKPYLDILRRRGVKLPGEPGYKTESEGEDDMAGNQAAGAAIESLTGLVSDLANQLADSRSDMRPPEETPTHKADRQDNSAAGVGAHAMHAVVDGMGHAMKTMIETMAASAQSSQDPTKIITAVADLLKQRTPDQPVTTTPAADPRLEAVIEENRRLREQQEAEVSRRADQAERRAAEAEKAVQELRVSQSKTEIEIVRTKAEAEILAAKSQFQAQAPFGGIPGSQPVAGPSGMPAFQPMPVGREDPLGEIDRVLNTAERLRSRFRGDEDNLPRSRGSEQPWWASILMMGLPAISAFLNAAPAMVANWAAGKTGQGQVIPPAPAPPGPTAEQMAALAAGQPIEEVMTQGEGEQPMEQGQETSQADIQEMVAFLPFIANPIRKNLERNEEGAGADLADLLIEVADRLRYDQLRSLGQERLIGLLTSYPPIHKMASQVPERFVQLVNEFLNYDQIMAAREAVEQMGDLGDEIAAIAGKVPEMGSIPTTPVVVMPPIRTPEPRATQAPEPRVITVKARRVKPEPTPDAAPAPKPAEEPTPA